MPSDEASDFRDASRGERLQKVLAAAGVESRRRCEELILEGMVTVNGQLIQSLPAWVNPETDDIVVEGRRLPKADRKVYVMLNKPRRCLTTCDDPGGRRTVVDLVDHPLVRRLFPIGRLDYETSGLLLLTNDGDFANALAHPRYGVDKTYRVKMRGTLTDEAIESLAKGVFLVDRRNGASQRARRAGAIDVQVIRRDRERTTVDVTLKEGRNRQIRRMLAQLGHPVVRLERIRMGPIKLKGLQRGEWRELTGDEIHILRRVAKKGSASKPRSRGARS